jgi:hypothetical protein
MAQLDFGGAESNSAGAARRNEDLAHRHLSCQSKLAGCFCAMNLDYRLRGISNRMGDALGAWRHISHEPIHPRSNVNTLSNWVDYTFVGESGECVVHGSPWPEFAKFGDGKRLSRLSGTDVLPNSLRR